MNKYKNLLIITIIAVLLIPMIISCQNEVSQGVYIPDDIWMVNGKTYYAFSEAMAALESGKDSKAIDETNTIRLLRDVGEFERGEGIVVPESYTGEIEINLGGYEYWFQDDIEYFLEIKGGTAVNIVNGTTVISEDANIIPKALIVNTEVVKLEDQKIDDRRPTPQAIEIQSKGIVEISSGTEISGDITVSGGGQLGVKGGSLSSSNIEVTASSDNTRESKIEIESGTFTIGTLTANSDDSSESKAAVINVKGGTVAVDTLDAKSNSTFTVKEASSSVKTEVTIGALTAEGKDSENKATVSVTSGTMTINSLDAKSNSEISIKETDSDVTTTVTVRTITAEGTDSSSKAKLEVTSGTFTVSDTLAAKKNSEVNIKKETSTSEEKKAVVVINTITSEGTDDTSTSTEAARVSITAGEISISTLNTKENSTMTMTDESGSEDDVNVVITNTKSEDSSKIKVDSGNVIFADKVEANGITENTGTLELNGGTVRGSDVEKLQEAKSNTNGSTTDIIEYHKASVHHEKVEATCTEAGTKEYWECEYCDCLFTSEDCSDDSKVESDDLIIEATGHNASSEWSYDENGHWHECLNGCGTHLDETEHTVSDEWVSTDPDSHYHICHICGAHVGEESHSFGDWEAYGDISRRTCSVCSRVEYGDHIHNMTATAEKSATCTEDGNLAYWHCSVCDKYYLDSEGEREVLLKDTVIPATGHDYGEPEWTWADDKSSATAKFTCENDSTHVENVSATVTSAVTTEATCSAEGVKTYTATATFNGNTYNDSKTESIAKIAHTYDAVVTEPTITEQGYTTYTCSVCGHTYIDNYTSAIGYLYSDPVFTWAEDNSSVTVVFTCTNDSSQTKTYTLKPVTTVVKAPTCTDKGQNKLTVSITFNDKTYPDTKTVDVEAKGHSYGGPVWTWNEDYSKATAKFTCKNDSTHYKEFSVDTTSSVKIAATCTQPGTIEYTASVVFNGKTETDSKEETIPATGHSTNLEHKEKVEATCTTDGNLEYWYCPQCEKYFSDAECKTELTSIVIKAKGHTYPDTYSKDETSHWKTCSVCGAETTHEAHTEETVTYSATGTHLTVTWGCKVCGNESGTPTAIPQPSTGAFKLVQTYNGVNATEQSAGVWVLTLDESVLTEMGAVKANTKWIGGNNTTVITGETSITVTINDGISNGEVLTNYYDNDGNLVGGGYAILPGKAANNSN